MTKTFEEKKIIAAQLGMIAIIHATNKLNEQSLIQKAQNASNEEEKVSAVKQGVQVIKDSLNEMFKDGEEAQEMKSIVSNDLIRHHYKFFGMDIPSEYLDGYEDKEEEAGE